MTLDGLDGGRAEQAVHSAAESALDGADQITAACPVANHARIDGRTPVGALVRHLLADPVLPPELLPDQWPGGELRKAYAAFAAELAERRDQPMEAI